MRRIHPIPLIATLIMSLYPLSTSAERKATVAQECMMLVDRCFNEVCLEHDDADVTCVVQCVKRKSLPCLQSPFPTCNQMAVGCIASCVPEQKSHSCVVTCQGQETECTDQVVAGCLEKWEKCTEQCGGDNESPCTLSCVEETHSECLLMMELACIKDARECSDTCKTAEDHDTCMGDCMHSRNGCWD